MVADRAPVAKQVMASGSIKWLEKAPFDGHDLGVLHGHRTKLPGAAPDAPLIVVARSGCAVDGVAGGPIRCRSERLLISYTFRKGL